MRHELRRSCPRHCGHPPAHAKRRRACGQRHLDCRNWLIGAYIHEYELQGQDRAEYGEQLIQRLADTLRKQGVSTCERPRLYACLSFYRVYPQIREAVLKEWPVKGAFTSAADEIFRSLTGKSASTEATGTVTIQIFSSRRRTRSDGRVPMRAGLRRLLSTHRSWNTLTFESMWPASIVHGSS